MLQNVVKGWNGHQTNMVKELKIRNGTFKKGKFDTFEHYEKRVMKNLINPHIIHD